MIFRDDMKFSDEEYKVFQQHLIRLGDGLSSSEDELVLSQLIVLFFASESLRRLYMRKDYFKIFMDISSVLMAILQEDKEALNNWLTFAKGLKLTDPIQEDDDAPRG